MTNRRRTFFFKCWAQILLPCALIFATLAFAGYAGAAAITYTFDSDAQGWTGGLTYYDGAISDGTSAASVNSYPPSARYIQTLDIHRYESTGNYFTMNAYYSGALVYTASITNTAWATVTINKNVDRLQFVRQDGTGSGNGWIYPEIDNVVTTDVATNSPPTVTGSGNTTINDQQTATPFSGLTVADADGDNVSLTITYTAANGTLSGTGLSGSAGSYTMSAAAPSTITSQLRALVFTPTNNQVAPGSSVTTTFTITPADPWTSGTANTGSKVTTNSLNDPPTGIAISNNSVSINGGVNAVVGTLSSTDPDTGDSHTYTLVAGTGDTDNALFNISGDVLRADDTSTMAEGQYSVRVQTTDSQGASYSSQMTITVYYYPPVTVNNPDDNLYAYITNVTIGSINKDSTYDSTNNQDGYSNYTALSTDLMQGSSQTISVTIGGSDVTGQTIAVFFDWNQDGDFEDAGETVTVLSWASGGAACTGSPCTSAGPYTANFTVPATALLGPTRMRVVTDWDRDPLPSGNIDYGEAEDYTVNIVSPVPGAPTGVSATAGDAQATVTFTAPASDGGSPITGYTATSNPGSFTGTCAGPAACPITVTGLTNGTAYTFTVTATNSSGTGPASSASNSVTPKASQTITFNNPGAQNYGTSPTLSATATSGLAVTFTSSTTGVCTIMSGGTLTFVTAGTCTIKADQAGNGTYDPAPTVTQSFTVNAVAPGAPTIGTATAGDAQASVTFTAPASNGGATITVYIATSNPGGFTGTGGSSPITVTGLTNGTAYTFTVTATNSAGTGAASSASNSVTPKASQTITFNNPGAQNYGTTPTLTATATSGLAVTFTSSTTGLCTITSGGTLTFVTAGTCTIKADQAGNGTYDPAPTVTQSFTVNAVAPGAPTGVSATAGDAQATVTFAAPASDGGSPITGYTATSNPGGLTGTGGSSPIVVTGLTNGTAYTFTVTATNSAGTGPASSASNSVTPKASQTITFNNPGAQNYGTSPTLSATATSGLAVTFTSSTTGVCTIASGGTLTFVTVGTCTIKADQAGNGTYAPAPTVTQSFTVNKASQTITGLASAPSTGTYGGTATLSVTGSGGSGNSVTYGSNTGSVCTVSNSTVSFIGAGTCTVTANQAGNTDYNAAPQVTLNITVNKASSSTTVVSSQNPSTYGQSVTFTATMTSGATGTVAFTEGTTTYCPASHITGTTATCNISSLSTGIHTITATYSGDSNYKGSSGSVSQTMNPTLTVKPSGAGSGSVGANGIDCSWDGSTSATGGTTCSGVYDYDSNFELTETPDTCSYFNGWSGACAGQGTTCNVTMDGDRTVGADFGLYPRAIDSSPVGSYDTLTAAYAAASGGEIYIQAYDFVGEDLLLDQSVDVTFDSGWSCDYTGYTGSATINGLTVEQGSLTLQGNALVIGP